MWVLGSFLFLPDPALWGKNKLPPKNLIANKLLNIFLYSYCWKRKFRFKAEACNPLFTECSCCYAIIIEYIMEQCGIMFLLTGMWRRCMAMPELLVISMLFICEGRSTFCSSSPKIKKAFIATFPRIFDFLWASYAEKREKTILQIFRNFWIMAQVSSFVSLWG